MQTQVLLRTREKLALLEQRVTELEAKFSTVPAVIDDNNGNDKTGE